MILAILQARMSSSRLPGKVVKKVKGEPILKYEISRIRQSKKIEKLVLATSLDCKDDILEELAAECKIDCFRGSLENVLERFYNCAIKYHPTHIVRLTGDCPIIDPVVIDDVINLHIKSGSDYTSNSFERSFPDGLDVEVMTFEALKKAYSMAKTKDELEHVTCYIYTHADEFKITQLKNDKNYSHVRWTLDTEDDFLLISKIIESQIDNNFKWMELIND